MTLIGKPYFQDRGYGTSLLDFAKDQGLPIKVIARNQSKDFFISCDDFDW
jgi:hypothetical protein